MKLGATVDRLFQAIGKPGGTNPPLPLEPVPWDPGDKAAAAETLDTEAIVKRLRALREDVSAEDFRKQVRNPIASRVLAAYVVVDIPDLKKRMVFDTRVDNPKAIPESLRNLSPEQAAQVWPQAEEPHDLTVSTPKGHGGSTCPGMFSGYALFKDGLRLEIPVEILAFHAEGHNRDVAYGITMYSEVTGRMSAPEDETSPGTLTMWGKMLISIKPDHPAQFGGHKYIELVSKDYIEQKGTVTGFPPKHPGEYLESAGNEVYVGHLPGQRHLTAIVERGRIIFSTDVDDFLQARTRITSFTLIDKHGAALDPGPLPFSPALIGKIAGAHMTWEDIRSEKNKATHYRLYRINTDDVTRVDLIGERLQVNEYTDWQYDGTRSYAYAVVPAFIDHSGAEVQGVSLDHSKIMAIKPRPEQFAHRNFGVGHVRKLK